MRLRFLGQACTVLEGNGHLVLMDPYLTGNPWVPQPPPELRPTAILLTHGHDDHFGDTAEIARKQRCPVVAMAELAKYCADLGLEAIGANYGGSVSFPWGRVKFVPAWHTSTTGPNRAYTGSPAGLLIWFFDRVIYHAGDTALFGDMQLIGDEAHIDVALLPIGDRYTMGPRDAVRAARLLRPRAVVPTHYNTRPFLRQDPEEFRRQVEAETSARCLPLHYEDELSLETLERRSIAQ